MMNKPEQMKIKLLRLKGKGYRDIAREVSIKESTVRMFCYRHGLSNSSNVSYCVFCDRPIQQNSRGQRKVFCSEKCRSACRRMTGDLKQTRYQHICEGCGKPFETIGNKNQKYCSRDCYINRGKNDDRVLP